VNAPTFYGTSYRDLGNATSDVVNIGGLSQTMTFGDLTQVGYNYYYNPIDGVFGLSGGNSSNKLPTALQQIASGLAQPIVTLHSNLSYYYTADAEILFGSKALPQCNQSNWQTISLMTPTRYRTSPWVPANATSISIASPGVAGGCDNFVNATHPLQFTDNSWKTTVSVQALNVFKKASNAVFDASVYGYTVDCAQIPNLMNVNIGLADGNTLVLTPQDYTYYSQWSGKCYLMVTGAYDDGDTTNSWYSIRLGQLWLNRHCVSYDINANTLSYTDALPNNGN